ncbi:MAG TPA: ATP-dependent RecD-like DNA helicase [Solirubrobacterales bacterium]|jgi:exodeoxyribonuclease V alpha subunit|nr:ATP-dependent RecD-like DNA helicase [Solirubrobacterales bacterium]
MRAATLFDADAASYSGTVEVVGVIYKADDDGYAVLEVQETESGEGFALVGPVAHLEAGDRAEVSGEWQTHNRYGRQLRAQGALPLDPADREGQVAYLTSLRHIGQKRAETLCDEYGEGVLQAIAADPQRAFSSLRGVSADQAAAATQSWFASRAIRDLHVQLAPHGLAHLAAPIHARYGEQSMTVLHEDPYRLTEVPGVGFARADKIALAADVPPESSRRAQAAALYTLIEAESQGNSYLPLEELTRRTGRLIGLAPDPDVLAQAPGLVEEEGRIYRAGTLESERAAAATLATRVAAPPHLDHDPGEEPRDDLTDEQWAAVRAAFGARISVLTGGPGVGKTKCTKEIVAEAEAANATIALCAPTGRAARRLEEATGHEAMTIHRLLEWMPGREPAYRPGKPLPAELVIVDESSMLNLRLIEVLLEGLAESTHVVFVGDADQLPPIGAGKPFEDLIASEAAPVVRLTQIFRQAARSMITTAAHEINHGRPPHLEPGPDQDHDFFFIERGTAERAVETVVEVVAERAPGKFAVDPIREVQVLAPMYRGPAGIDALNERLQAELNPDGKPALSERFRVGDRLIQTRNSHELGLMNGSIVFLRADDPDEETIVVDTDDGGSLVIPYGETATLRLAYAISVHKAQGCEVPVVVAVCHRSHSRMLNRPLLYTAITRARNSCVLVGDQASLASAVRRDDSGGRHSGLAERLRGSH